MGRAADRDSKNTKALKIGEGRAPRWQAWGREGKVCVGFPFLRKRFPFLPQYSIF
ncbi:hypothetical protein WCP94_002068 [Bilophila wadsworthia]